MTTDPGAMLVKAVRALNACRIPYMVVGSIASTLYGEGRSTWDVDLVIDPSPEQLRLLSQAVKADFFFDERAAFEALARRDMFCAMPRDSAGKIDFILLKDRPFSHSEFQRRQTKLWRDEPMEFVSAEDCILSKLHWARLGESERQFRDALGVAVMQWNALDMPYLHRWAAALDLGDWLSKLERQAGKLLPRTGEASQDIAP